MHHAETIDTHETKAFGDTFVSEFQDVLGDKLLGEYKKATYDFAQLHPTEFVAAEFYTDKSRTFAILAGETDHTRRVPTTNALGFWNIPKIKQMPSVTRTSRAFVHAHNLSKPPTIGGPVQLTTTAGGFTGWTPPSQTDALLQQMGLLPRNEPTSQNVPDTKSPDLTTEQPEQPEQPEQTTPEVTTVADNFFKSNWGATS